ncbi:unnamed protein product, partial [Cylicostephanus goldi]
MDRVKETRTLDRKNILIKPRQHRYSYTAMIELSDKYVKLNIAVTWTIALAQDNSNEVKASPEEDKSSISEEEGESTTVSGEVTGRRGPPAAEQTEEEAKAEGKSPGTKSDDSAAEDKTEEKSSDTEEVFDKH